MMSCHNRPTRDAVAAGAGLLGLVACKAPAQRPPADPPETCEGDVPAPARTTGASTAARWAAAWRGGGTAPDVAESGCQMCALAAWCEALSRNRSGALVAHVVQERWTGQLLANPNTARLQEEVLFALRRRHDFWTAFLDLCGAQHDSLAVWPNPRGAVLRELHFEALGYAKSTAAVLVKAQARWRGVKARRSFRQLRLEQICQTLPQSQLGQLTKVQALWRGQRRRSSLRAQGVVLPLDRRSAKLKRAATQLQAALRGSRVRRKLRWAREVSRMVGDDLEDPTADLQELLAAAQSAAARGPGFLHIQKNRRAT
ncbi:unnamed protein product [Effrenium voratum]|nr:unnamed protein product [Effrenium voratum]